MHLSNGGEHAMEHAEEPELVDHYRGFDPCGFMCSWDGLSTIPDGGSPLGSAYPLPLVAEVDDRLGWFG